MDLDLRVPIGLFFLAVGLIMTVFGLTSNPAILGARSNPRWLAVLGWITVAVMTLASAAMFATWK